MIAGGKLKLTTTTNVKNDRKCRSLFRQTGKYTVVPSFSTFRWLAGVLQTKATGQRPATKSQMRL